MAEYEEPRARKQVAPRPSRAIPPPTPTPRTVLSSPRQDIETKMVKIATKTRLPRELAWYTVEGVEVLASSIPNYVAERTPQGTYSIIRLEPRAVVARRIRLMHVMDIIRREHEKVIAHAVREAEKQRQSEAEERTRFEDFENQPGFYIVPGETVGPDDKTYNATGPYWRFETLNPNFQPPEDDYQITDNDVVDEAWQTSSELGKQNDSTPVVIIEARNPREAAQGIGHVWWVEGMLKGPPIDPRQTGFNW